MALRSVGPQLGRGLTIQGQRLFTHKRVCFASAAGARESHITWTWSTDSAEDHLGWFLGRLETILGPDAVLGELREWCTRDCDTDELLLLHGWLCGIKLDMPRTGSRAIMRLTLSPDVAIEQ
jgi:hypothetical protein